MLQPRANEKAASAKRKKHFKASYPMLELVFCEHTQATPSPPVNCSKTTPECKNAKQKVKFDTRKVGAMKTNKPCMLWF